MSRKIAHGNAVSDALHESHIASCANRGGIVQAKNYTAHDDDDIGSHVWFISDEDNAVYHSSIDACNAPLPDVSGKQRK
jgi:hypothetical protein